MMEAAPDIFVGCHDYEGQRGNNIAMILLKIVLPIIYCELLKKVTLKFLTAAETS